MADLPKFLLTILRGDFDPNLGDIAEALSQRQSDLTYQQMAAAALAAYVELSGISVEDVLKSLTDEE